MLKKAYIVALLCIVGITGYPVDSAAGASGAGVLASASMSSGQSPQEIEYGIKAAFIYNFLKFIDWSDSSHVDKSETGPSSPLRIGILGVNPFGSAFDPILSRDINGRTIELAEFESFSAFRSSYSTKSQAVTAYKSEHSEALRHCHILYICSSEKEDIAEVASLVSGLSVVTISDLPKFAGDQGMIGFVISDKKVRFEVNLVTMKKENVRISSQLLQLAQKVYKE